MIRSLFKVALLSISASSNAVLSTRYNLIDETIKIEKKYSINKELSTNLNNPTSQEDIIVRGDALDFTTEDVNDPYTDQSNYGYRVNTKFTYETYEGIGQYINFFANFISCYQYGVDEGETYWVDNIRGKPFICAYIKIWYNQPYSIITRLTNIEFDYQGDSLFVGSNNGFIANYKLAYSNNNNLDIYTDQTLDEYYELSNYHSITAEMPFNFKNDMKAQFSTNGTMAFNETWTFAANTNWQNIVNYHTENSMQADINKYPAQNLYLMHLIEIERAMQTQEIDIDTTEWFAIPDQNEWIQMHARYYAVENFEYEVINVPEIMFTIIGMPFTFISKAFDLTLFPSTPYAINIGNIFLSIIGILTFILVLKIILKMVGK